MKALLFDSNYVDIGRRSSQVGGSFQRRSFLSATAWDGELLKIVHDELKRETRPTLLDIGANTGSFSLLAALLPDLSAHAFEPSPITFPLLVENLERNGVQDRVIAHQVALTDFEGTIALKISRDSSESGLACVGRPLRFGEYEEHAVTATTLDALDLPPAAVIKIDTEGCEPAVLRGARATIQKTRPKLFMEFNEENLRQFGSKPDDVLALLEELDYDVEHVAKEDLFARPRPR